MLKTTWSPYAENDMKRTSIVVLSFLILSLFVCISTAMSQKSSFAVLQFGEDITIEVPRDWTYLDDNMKRHINTFSEAVLKLSGISLNQGDNKILVAANAYTRYSTPSATLRLSVRPKDAKESITQSEMRQEAPKLSKKEVLEMLAPTISETKRAMLNIEGIRSVKLIDARIEQSKHLTCLLTEFENSADYGISLVQVYVCPAGDKSIKLTTSYRKSEAIMFKPTLKYVWNSLRVR